MESIYDVILEAKGKQVTLSLSSGLQFTGVLAGMTYFNKEDKNMRTTPRLLTLVSGDHFHYVDAIKVDLVSIMGGLVPNK